MIGWIGSWSGQWFGAWYGAPAERTRGGTYGARAAKVRQPIVVPRRGLSDEDILILLAICD